MLPVEIILQVLEHVDNFDNRDRTKTLYSCVLVSKAWNLLTSPLLWKNPKFKTEEHVPTSFSSYTKYVKKLEFSVVDGIRLETACAMIKLCPNLRDLTLKYVVFTPQLESLRDSLTFCPQLRSIDMRGSSFESKLDGLMDVFSGLTKLESVCLENCNVSSKHFTEGYSINSVSSSMRRLVLDCNSKLDCPTFSSIIKRFSSLEIISARCCTSLQDDGLLNLVQQPLRSLDLTATGATSDVMAEILKHNHRIEQFLFGSSSRRYSGITSNLSSECLSHLSQNKNLTHLVLGGQDFLSDEDVLPILQNCRQISEIDLSFTSITEKTVFELASLPNLATVSLIACNKITNTGSISLDSKSDEETEPDCITSLILRAHSLKHLDCSEMQSMTKSYLKQYAKSSVLTKSKVVELFRAQMIFSEQEIESIRRANLKTI
ncbi:hypothetical protein MP638_004131 [Amoeboaphelidium occidentale]|nr:hypothetical protein MP638_004131 [Amoeboaphelidium occidentale]